MDEMTSQNFFSILWWSQHKPTETSYNHFLCAKHTCAASSIPEFYSDLINHL